MSRPEICPTCGTKLSATQPRPESRVCSACSRSNPAGFNYCGFCATPMENTEMGARMADLAAPPGGWPSLTSELVEVRFYLQQGLFDDAYELLSIMQKRHPGHPQLTELARRPKPTRRVDTGVLALVDRVLADSANLVAKMPRRAATRFSAPAQGGADRTDVHGVVEPPQEEQTTARAAKPPKTGPQSPTRRSGPQRAATPSATPTSAPTTGSQRAKPNSGSQRTTMGPKPTPPAPRPAAAPRAAAPAAPRERTRIYRTVEPPASTRNATPAPVAASRAARGPAVTGETVVSRPPQSGHTVVVEALQSPTPFPAQQEAAAAPKGSRKRNVAAPAKPVAAAPTPSAPAAAPAEPEPPEPRRRARFGEHVLNRLR